MHALAQKETYRPLRLYPRLVSHNVINPMSRFDDWFQEASLNKKIIEANTVNLATVSATGQPSNRMVSMKNYDSEGLVFFTNPNSHKGQDLTANPKVSLCFFWEPLNRQIRIEGLVESINSEEADAYFSKQSRQEQIRAWVSEQSQTLDNLTPVKQNIRRITHEFGTVYIPRPPTWSGYKVRPHTIEFMQRETHGLDRREIYQLATNSGWTREVLSS